MTTEDVVAGWVMGGIVAAGVLALAVYAAWWYRTRKKLPAPSRHDRQAEAERIVSEYLRDALTVKVLSSDGLFVVWPINVVWSVTVRLPCTIWVPAGNRTLAGDLVVVSSWEGYAHEVAHAVLIQLGHQDPYHNDAAWFGPDGHVIKMQGLLNAKGLS